MANPHEVELGAFETLNIPERGIRKRFINVSGEYEGFHWYEDAPDEVAFLKHRHRHLFKWNATVQVFHDDREIEFFMLKDVIKKQIMPFIQLTDNLGSCEQQAERILQGLINTYGDHRIYYVAVSEDGENEGQVTYEP